MKSILPWFVAFIGIAGAIFFYKASDAKSATVASLQQQVAEMETLRAENEALKKDQLPADELARLTAAKDELPRLRNMVRQLTTDKSQLNQQVQAAQEAAQRAARIATNKPLALDVADPYSRYVGGYGYATPWPAGYTDSCVNNLRQIDAAKQQWALENNKTAEATPTEAEVKMYFKDGIIFTCPANGKYTLGNLSVEPICSVAGHALAK